MVVKKITRSSGSDFWGDFECEHCGSISTGRGYSDGFYYENVIPLCKCPVCDLQSREGEEKTSYDGFKVIEKKEISKDYKLPESYYAGEPEKEGWKESDRSKNMPILW